MSLYDRISLYLKDNKEKVSTLSHARRREYMHLLPSCEYKDLNNSSFARASAKLDKKISVETDVSPGDCENCPAGAKWALKGPGLWCLYSEYFLGKHGKVLQCDQARKSCSLGEGETKT